MRTESYLGLSEDLQVVLVIVEDSDPHNMARGKRVQHGGSLLWCEP